METAGERVKKLRKEAGLTQAELAKRIGVKAPAVTQWETGKTSLSGENLLKVAKVLNVSPDYILHGGKDGRSNISSGPEIKGRYPLISWVAAGAWCDITEIHPADAVLYPCPVSCSDRTFVLRVQGISMEPLFRDGDLIFIDPAADVRHGSYVVARLDDHNEATFKKLIIEGGQKYLKPVNPNWPEQIIAINGNCTIVGPVVFSGRVF
ncbi:S24 family peptidase [Oceanisphaera sediminis]|uniref:S24 family peptidase n=1 Tax=Oceanisphaera sediminis TaxID=981381 RepID=A0ABP7DDC4_9GAMM